jgi:GMP reductase
MHIEPDVKLDFKDVLIRPKRSTLGSRADVEITRSFRFLSPAKEWTGFPLIAANMDTIGTMAMARALAPFNSMVSLHKFYEVSALVEFFNGSDARNVFYTIGTTETDREKFEQVKSKVALTKISIDVAMGILRAFSAQCRSSEIKIPALLSWQGRSQRRK